MKKTARTLAAAAVVVALIPSSMATAETLTARFIGRPQVLADNSSVPFASRIPDDALCFKVEMYDVSGSQRIGTGWDCLSDIRPDDETFARLTLTDYSIFKFKGRGRILAVGDVSIQVPHAGAVAPPTTHVTGSSPAEPNILKGRGQFAGATGRVRLSGLVDMSTVLDDGLLGFDCIFVIELDA